MSPHIQSLVAPARAQHDIADIFRDHGDAYRDHYFASSAERRVMGAISNCRTAVLGGHVDVCDRCGPIRISYNSCRNRHCPKCQSLPQARWIERRKQRVLPVPHFHVVFTLPSRLRTVAWDHPRTVYTLLFRVACNTLMDFGRDPRFLGGQLGITAVLHTWTRELNFHPHLHCVVTAGGLDDEGARWVPSKGGKRFLFPVKALAKCFRGRFMAQLEKEWRTDKRTWRSLRAAAYRNQWVVYAKRPFGSADHVFEYLGRYTHRVAISNQRLVTVTDQAVTFRTRGNQVTTVTPLTFIHRFLRHVLPTRFVKIRHYGLYASSNVNRRLQIARDLLRHTAQQPETPTHEPSPQASEEWWQLLQRLTGIDPRRCPHCGGTLRRYPLNWFIIPAATARAPPSPPNPVQ